MFAWVLRPASHSHCGATAMTAREAVEVTEADMDAASDAYFNRGISLDEFAAAFARHRIAAHQRGRAEGIEAAAMVADEWGVSVPGDEEAEMIANSVAPNIAVAIRAMKDTNDG
jgi:hypothetical protein